MTPLALADIPPRAVFEAAREDLRRAVAAHKAARRVAVGDRVTLLFEDRETVRWQVLEMCRVENVEDAAGIQHELDVYNELVPGPNELSATLFIEITDPARIRPELDRLVGIDEHVWLVVGGERVRARFDTRQLEEDRISAVHYLRFALSPAQAEALADPGVAAALAVDHAAYRAEAELPLATRASLAAGLGGDPPPLLDFARYAGAAAAPRDEVIAQRGAARAVRPARPRARGHVVVELVAPTPTRFAELPADATQALVALAQEIARGHIAELGSARIAVDAETIPARVDVWAPD